MFARQAWCGVLRVSCRCGLIRCWHGRICWQVLLEVVQGQCFGATVAAVRTGAVDDCCNGCVLVCSRCLCDTSWCFHWHRCPRRVVISVGWHTALVGCMWLSCVDSGFHGVGGGSLPVLFYPCVGRATMVGFFHGNFLVLEVGVFSERCTFRPTTFSSVQSTSGHNILILYNRNRLLREYQLLTFGEG